MSLDVARYVFFLAVFLLFGTISERLGPDSLALPFLFPFLPSSIHFTPRPLKGDTTCSVTSGFTAKSSLTSAQPATDNSSEKIS